MVVACGLLVLLIGGVPSGPKAPTPRAPAARPSASTTPTVPSTPAASPQPTIAQSPSALVSQARALYEALEYDKVAPLAVQALASPDITLDEKLEAYQLQGSALAIVGDPVDAERPFLLLLTVRPDFVVPAETPPKIKSVFAKVKGEFDAVREAQEARFRKELASTIEIDGALPTTARGGYPVRFDFAVADPRGVIKSVRVQYRRQGEPEFLELPLQRSTSGRFVGVVPGEWTASPTGFTMEALVVASDLKGPLQRLGSPFVSIPVSAGALARRQPVPVWVFGTSAGVTGTLALVATSVTAASAWQGLEFRATLDKATDADPGDGADIVAHQGRGQALNAAAWATWGLTGVAVVVSGVLALFTNWSGEESDIATGSEPPASEGSTPETLPSAGPREPSAS
jgi:hypothetical protein